MSCLFNLDKLPLYKYAKYRLEGKKAKRASIQEIVDRYHFEKDKLYEIQAINSHYKEFDFEYYKNLSQYNAWIYASECAELRSIYIFNKVICADCFCINDKDNWYEITVDLDFISNVIEFDLGQSVNGYAHYDSETLTVGFCALTNFDGEYSRDSIMETNVIDNNYNVDLHYITIDKNGHSTHFYPARTLYRVNKEG